jgi:hypothetical protein
VAILHSTRKKKERPFETETKEERAEAGAAREK